MGRKWRVDKSCWKVSFAEKKKKFHKCCLTKFTAFSKPVTLLNPGNCQLWEDMLSSATSEQEEKFREWPKLTRGPTSVDNLGISERVP